MEAATRTTMAVAALAGGSSERRRVRLLWTQHAGRRAEPDCNRVHVPGRQPAGARQRAEARSNPGLCARLNAIASKRVADDGNRDEQRTATSRTVMAGKNLPSVTSCSDTGDTRPPRRRRHNPRRTSQEPARPHRNGIGPKCTAGLAADGFLRPGPVSMRSRRRARPASVPAARPGHARGAAGGRPGNRGLPPGRRCRHRNAMTVNIIVAMDTK